MYHPDFDSFMEKSERGNLIPVFRELPADLETPVSAFLKLRSIQPAFLLESVENGERVGRYSFIGTTPKQILSSRGDMVFIQHRGTQEEIPLGGRDPLHFLQEKLAEYEPVKCVGLPPFSGGAVGYLAYDIVRFFERLPEATDDELGLPDCTFLLTDTMIVFDHARRTMIVVAYAHVAGDLVGAYGQAVGQIEAIVAALRGPLPADDHPASGQAHSGVVSSPTNHGAPVSVPFRAMASNFTVDEFCRKVESAKGYIAAGDAFQIVLSQRLRRTTSADGFDIYRALRRLNPSPYMFFLDFGSYQLIGSSPEVLVKMEGRRACIRPLAGTRRRGANEAEDELLAKELLTDHKEIAEHVMLVDLARNDLGRVCRPGTVRAPVLLEVEKYSHVMHIVSEVDGEVADGGNSFDLLRASFPAGTVSGAPKIRAMEIIAELEGLRRGPYAGAVGYFGFAGDMDTCITIRTIVKIDESVYLQAGAGIVADSDPLSEYQETMNKLRALELAVRTAEELV